MVTKLSMNGTRGSITAYPCAQPCHMPSIRRAVPILALTYFTFTGANAQVLYAESFSIILDTARHVRGSITPEIKVQTQRELLVEVENTADVTVRIKQNSLTVANKIEFSSFGNEVFLSGGFVYARFKNELDKKLVLEYYGQVHWAEARGLERKYAGGANVRYRIRKSPKLGIFVGTGPFYEYERWNYTAVADDRLPMDPIDIEKSALKWNTYVSYKQWVHEKVFVDVSLYHQAEPASFFSAQRFASSTRVGYQLTKSLQLVLIYQNLYDEAPVVPVDKWFHRAVLSVSVVF